ncbi:unnamed protein product [Pleuronectes platessa]|uniref:Uncharacterized protein n=1 Tax=Pleuronectes platessa TaxID=8262 RepID=A0A9N7VAS0_PLEPL|nr:unnamed protein product [Pleuronectes platessa]
MLNHLRVRPIHQAYSASLPLLGGLCSSTGRAPRFASTVCNGHTENTNGMLAPCRVSEVHTDLTCWSWFAGIQTTDKSCTYLSPPSSVESGGWVGCGGVLVTVSLGCVLEVSLVCVLDVSLVCFLEVPLVCFLDVSLVRFLDVSLVGFLVSLVCCGPIENLGLFTILFLLLFLFLSAALRSYFVQLHIIAQSSAWDNIDFGRSR